MSKVRTLSSLFLVPLLALVLAACGSPFEPIEVDDPRFPEGTFVEMRSQAFDRGSVAGEEYAFEFVARRIPADVMYVTFEWDYDDGTTGSETVTVLRGNDAMATSSHSFGESRAYVVGVRVFEDEEGPQLASNRRMATIGSNVEERENVVDSCEGWVQSNSGGVEGTVDRWDISEIPDGAVFSLRFDTWGIPDKILVDYPETFNVLDTGWRGHARHAGSNYPGGIEGGPLGEVEGVFTKAGGEHFVVTVIGVDPRTLWDYWVSCEVPAN